MIPLKFQLKTDKVCFIINNFLVAFSYFNTNSFEENGFIISDKNKIKYIEQKKRKTVKDL